MDYYNIRKQATISEEENFEEDVEIIELDPEPKRSQEDHNVETVSEKNERETTAMTPLQIFDECFLKYISKIGNSIGWNVLDAHYTVGPITILWTLIIFNACTSGILTVIFADPPTNIFVLGEVGIGVQVTHYITYTY